MDVCFVGCHDQERAHFGAAWMAIEQGVLRDLKQVVEALEEAKDARSKLSRASGIILTGNGAEAIYSLLTGLGGASHAHSPINVNMITNLIGSISLVIGGQRHRETSHLKDIKQLQKPIFSQGLVSGLVAVAAYGIGYWLQPDPLFAGTFAFATLILSQLLHTWQWSAKSHANNLNDMVAERTLVVGLGVAVVVLGLALYIPGVANVLNLVPLGVNDWLAALAVASSVGPITVKVAYPLWESIKGRKMRLRANRPVSQGLKIA